MKTEIISKAHGFRVRVVVVDVSTAFTACAPLSAADCLPRGVKGNPCAPWLARVVARADTRAVSLGPSFLVMPGKLGFASPLPVGVKAWCLLACCVPCFALEPWLAEWWRVFEYTHAAESDQRQARRSEGLGTTRPGQRDWWEALCVWSTASGMAHVSEHLVGQRREGRGETLASSGCLVGLCSSQGRRERCTAGVLGSCAASFRLHGPPRQCLCAQRIIAPAQRT